MAAALGRLSALAHAYPEPVGDEVVRPFGVLEAGDVGETDEILLALRKHRDGGPLDFDGVSWRFGHAMRGAGLARSGQHSFSGPRSVQMQAHSVRFRRNGGVGTLAIKSDGNVEVMWRRPNFRRVEAAEFNHRDRDPTTGFAAGVAMVPNRKRPFGGRCGLFRSFVQFQDVRRFEGFLLLAGKAAFDLFHVLGRRKGFRADAAFQQGASDGVVVGNVLA